MDANSEAFSSSSSSFTTSYSDGSDLANWEEYVADDGSLFYVEYMPNATRTTERRVEFMRLGKKSGRRQQQQQQQQQKPQTPQSHSNRQSQSQSQSHAEEFRFSQLKTSDSHKQLELVITAADRFRFGRRSTAVESILGFRVQPFPDQPECLMVESFVHDISALQHQGGTIKRGDWFKSLNGIELYASNVDELLQQFIEPTQVCLGFQGNQENDDERDLAKATAEGGGAENQGDIPGSAGHHQQITKVVNFSMFADQFERMMVPTSSASSETGSMPFALLLLPPECYQQDQHKDSLYYYPENPSTNFLYKARGSFLTLHAVLSELQTQPLTSRLRVGEDRQIYHVNYRRLNGFLLLLAYSSNLFTEAECHLRSDELMGYIRFSLPGLTLDNFTSNGGNSGGGSDEGLRLFLRHFCSIQRSRLLATSSSGPHIQFEQLLRQSCSLPLPKEAQLRIFDALSEMEAMDYRNWNDEPLTTHREFFIYGSALYYEHYLLASLLPASERVQVEGFLRCRGIFDFIGNPKLRVRELYVWEEIVMPNATGRYFLTVCTRNHLSLAVILKIFDAPDMAPDAIVAPSLFYIEEIQETLDHLVQCGIESLAMFWSISNKRPEVLNEAEKMQEHAAATSGTVPDPDKEETVPHKLESFLKQKLTVLSSTNTNSSAAVDEETGQQCSSLGGSSIHSLTPSEDDSSRRRLTPIHGPGPGEDSDSGSDWENFAVQHPLHFGENQSQSQMTESMWKEINNVVPVKISAGWKNSVLYYVYIDLANGSLFAPLNSGSESLPFLSEIRKACHLIHSVLERSKHYRRPSMESSTSTSSSHSQSVAKEHGITLNLQGEGLNGNGLQIVVIGRLFQSPAKEVYVCHRAEVPQNIIEMAFRLSFFSMG
ncbi:protein inturned [Drosophila tropicalis]|uniref:protein inturned n=1 Tax=Drosophila tropicalis TaxID=46794 RepID=UPI0035ABAEB0